MNRDKKEANIVIEPFFSPIKCCLFMSRKILYEYRFFFIIIRDSAIVSPDAIFLLQRETLFDHTFSVVRNQQLCTFVGKLPRKSRDISFSSHSGFISYPSKMLKVKMLGYYGYRY